MKLKSLQIIQSGQRITSVDIFRSIAILTVVLFHFNHTLPYGYLGVDLFFVISGLLVGGILTREFIKNKKIQYLKFFLQRAGKIWPSYFFFMFFGSVLAWLFYENTIHQDQIIASDDYYRYLFFYQNYTGVPFHWSFDHVWSICVEEHFYLILPLMFILVASIFRAKAKWLFLLTIATIIAGVVFKYASLYLTTGQDTYSGTHNRIDALAWGVLLNLLIHFKWKEQFIDSIKLVLIILGIIILGIAIYLHTLEFSAIYNKIWFQAIVPFSFFLMILGAYKLDFSRFVPFRFIAYYSYNWYLWHPIFVMFIGMHLGYHWWSLLVYLIISFAMAMLVTILIEEPILTKRDYWLKRNFK